MEPDTIETTVYDEDTGAGLFADEPATATHHVPVPQQLVLLGVVLLLLFAGTISPHVLALIDHARGTIPAATADSTANTSQVVSTSTAVSSRPTSDPFKSVHITGKAAFVWDINNQKALYAKNPNEPLPLASVTKLMTALLADELLSATSTIHIGNTAIDQEGNSGLRKGEKFNRQTLTDLTLMISSNDGAYALATATGKLIDPAHPADAFVNAMNVRAKQLGLTHTYYKNPTGLDITTTQPGSEGSVRDMAHLMQYIILHHPEILTYTRDNTSTIYSSSGFAHDAKNTNYDVTKIPGLIGSKTGYTDLAGGNLIVAFDAGLNRPIVVVVLGSTEQDRFTDVLALVHAAEKYVAEEKK